MALEELCSHWLVGRCSMDRMELKIPKLGSIIWVKIMATDTMEMMWGRNTEAWASRSIGVFLDPSHTASSSEKNSTAAIMTTEYSVVFFMAILKAAAPNILA